MKTSILSSHFKEIFPLSTEKGGDSSGINHQKMRLMAKHGILLKTEDIQKILIIHHEFLASGGAEGQWKALQVGDVVLGFYDLPREVEGTQAIFERMNLSQASFQKLELPFSTFCGAFAPAKNFSFSNLSYSLCTDATLENACFEGANLKKVDFSRSNLRNASFVNANLSGADFENCDLSGADFTGAKISTARFPGANLKDVKC